MSGMMNKVKDALKSDDSNGHHGKHGQTTAMPGSYESTTPNTGAGYGTAHTTAQPTTGGLGSSKYGAEPSQSSYAQDHGALGGTHTNTTTHTTTHGTGFGTGTGTTGSSTSPIGGHSRKQVPESKLMDPADRSHESNIMDRSRDGYTGTDGTTLGHSGSNKLHKSNDPRSNVQAAGYGYDDKTANSPRTAGYGDTTRTGYGDTNRHSANYGDKTSSSKYDNDSKYDNNNNTNDGQPLHNNKMLNKLDPRVDNEQIPDNKNVSDKDYRGSDYSSRDTARDHYGGNTTHSGNTTHTSGGAPALPNRNRDERRDEIERGDFSRDRDSRSGHNYNNSSTTGGDRYDDRQYDNSRNTNKSSSINPFSSSRKDDNRGGYSDSHSNNPMSSSGKDRSHFHCMGCGHRNDVSYLTDARGGKVMGRKEFHCMDCGHKNQVGHLIK